MSKFGNELLYSPDMYDEDELKLYIKEKISEYEEIEALYLKTIKKQQTLYNSFSEFNNIMCCEPPNFYQENIPDDLTNYVSKMKESGISFQDQLKEYLRIKNLKDSEVYNSIGMSEKAFNKIKNQTPDKSISFDMAVMIAFGLHLNFNEMIDMIALAGKSLKKNDIRHIIVRYFFEKEKYDIDALNVALYANKEKTFLTPKEEKETDCGIEM